MARIYPTFIMFLLHVFLGFEIYNYIQPYTADYPGQSAFIAIDKDWAEITLNGEVHKLQCTPHQNTLGEWEAVETATADFIKVGANGTTTARIGGKYMAFLPE